MTPQSIGVLVRVDRTRDRVVQDLTAAGMQVERVMRRLGVVSGTVPREQLAGLGRIEGVTAVERDREVRTA
ncbi:MAG: hypothetical protein M3P93_17815 [Actinomycetota bacterium]|nr:hypothetical protein [Actinomycetota bacterium]